MKNRRILSLFVVVLVISILFSNVLADEENGSDQSGIESNSGMEIDEGLNQKLLEYLENLDEDDLDPNRNEDNYTHYSDEEIYRQWYQDEFENRVNCEYIPEGSTNNTKSDPTGFYSIGSDIYYTDPVTNVRYCNTTLTYEHIVFTFGSDYKVTSIVPQYAYFSARRVKVLLEAFNQIGKPYVMPANVPDSFTCGSFVAYVFLESLDVHLRAGSGQQIEDIENGVTCIYNNRALNLIPEFITESELLPGDVIYWYSPVCASGMDCPFSQDPTPTPCGFYHGVHHSAIYIGNGQVVEAVHNNSASGVIVGDIRDMTSSGLYIYGYVRYINEEVTLPAVTGLSANPAGKNKVVLEWQANKYTDGYLIYTRKNGVYSYFGMTRDIIDIDPNLNNVILGCCVFDYNASATGDDYYVFPYVTDYSGTMYPGTVSIMVTAAGICPAVANLALTPLPGSIMLTWTGSTDAEGYLIYGIRGSGTYGYIGMTTLGTTYTDTLASTTQLNRYWVFPFYRDGNNQIIPGVISDEVNGLAL